MEEIERIKETVIAVWGQEALGSDVGTLMTALGIFVVFALFRSVFARFLIARLGKLTAQTKTTLDDHLFTALEKPLSLIPVLIGLFIATSYLDPKGSLATIIYDFEKSLIAIVLFWSFYNMVDPVARALSDLERIFSKPMVEWLRKGLKVFVFLVGAAAVLEIWGIQVGPVIAGLGLFGVAVALGAQDMFKNLIAGLTA